MDFFKPCFQFISVIHLLRMLSLDIMFTPHFYFLKFMVFIIGLRQKNPLKRNMILELKKKDGLAKQMLQTAKLSDFCPVYKAFPSVVRVITVSTV